MIAKGHWKNREIKSIIWRLFFCDSRALFRAELLSSRVRKIFWMFSRSSRARAGIFRGSGWLRPEFQFNQLYNDQKPLQYRSCSKWIRKAGWQLFEYLVELRQSDIFLLRRGTSGNETVYPANLQFIIVSEKQCLLWHKPLMSWAEWSKLTSLAW